jgi:tRNA(adenine34) deaminase
MMENICEVCEKPIKECICCPECGHICSLDRGEYYCPVCFPEKDRTDEYYMRIALEEAETAFLKGEVPVGAVLVENGKIIAKAHNIKETTNDPIAHAELILIKKGASILGNWRLTNTTIYVTKEPCVMCAGAMVNARLGRLVYGCKDSRYGAITSRYKIASDPMFNHQIDVTSGILEDECSEILKRFFTNLRKK